MDITLIPQIAYARTVLPYSLSVANAHRLSVLSVFQASRSIPQIPTHVYSVTNTSHIADSAQLMTYNCPQ
jgi:hypothetical protein